MIVTERISVRVGADGEMEDVTHRVQGLVSKSGLRNGIVTVFNIGSTGAVSTVEYEPGLKRDIPAALERIAPSDVDYEHHKTWGDDNGRGHVRATVLGPSLVVPFVDGKLTLGTWQQIVAINLDTGDRDRKLVVQIIGE
ncbi:MAG: secondary thiamine-phosphate synthase enzyme YjbQ [Candidatus Altiarchaeales archaeon]|nr:secondary thiamine-phosphate synthase enzyme YjbQ [Candidatus Altiarchaeales archaeon]